MFIRLRSLSASPFSSSASASSMPRRRLSFSATLLRIIAESSVMRLKSVAGFTRALYYREENVNSPSHAAAPSRLLPQAVTARSSSERLDGMRAGGTLLMRVREILQQDVVESSNVRPGVRHILIPYQVWLASSDQGTTCRVPPHPLNRATDVRSLCGKRTQI